MTHVTRPDGGQLAMGNSLACVMPVIRVASSGFSITPSDVDRPEHEWRGEERKHIKHAVPWTAIRSAKVTVAHLVRDRHRQHRNEHGERRRGEARKHGREADPHDRVQEPTTPRRLCGPILVRRASRGSHPSATPTGGHGEWAKWLFGCALLDLSGSDRLV